jgi:hypothetical protein
MMTGSSAKNIHSAEHIKQVNTPNMEVQSAQLFHSGRSTKIPVIHSEENECRFLRIKFSDGCLRFIPLWPSTELSNMKMFKGDSDV